MPFTKPPNLKDHESSVSQKSIVLSILLSLAVFLLTAFLPYEQRLVLSILTLVSTLWVSEAIPLYVTSLSVPVLIVLLGLSTPKQALNPFFDPIIALFIGGLLLARALHIHELDTRIAWTVLSWSRSPKIVILLLMVITSFLSFWMSNTATTAIMIPIALVLVRSIHHKCSNFSKASILGVAYAANIGGIGTLVGSPPNVLAAGFLESNYGTTISFLDWMMMGIPTAILLLPIAWLILIKFFPITIKSIPSVHHKTKPLNPSQKTFIVIFLATLLLWFTSSIHGISSSIIALSSAIALFVFGLLKKDDMNSISWSTIILFGGGLVLGNVIVSTGLSQTLISFIQTSFATQAPFVFIFFMLVALALVNAVMPNTGLAAIAIPLLAPASVALGFNPVPLVMLIGIAASLDFVLPVGTPPNALAYATGLLKIKEMAKTGLVTLIIMISILSVISIFFWL